MTESPRPPAGSLARRIDISCVQAEHGRPDIDRLAAAARAHGFVSAHVLPSWVPELRELLAGSGTLAGAPVGFPSGGATTAAKLAEARELLGLGVGELDVVIAIGRLKSGETGYVRRELDAVRRLVDGAVPLRAIIEVGRLTEEEIRAAAHCVAEAGVPWLKTGTGWSGRPTTPDHIRLIRAEIGEGTLLKAAGGIRDLATIRTMEELGVRRFGMNLTAAVAAVTAAGEAAA
ncbi:deoxyribose-phosphate aldolase [Streptomyces hoynatensis]|uniref:Deoxyribose-phosphate aldolase n=1 Tax=Streptomyces hoynatensis TaxID=1141874 RepID=A0A3A9YW92_9ACTN|nr:deoxyribose-phosphate aldolase [Streptomyces hoynatensis]RKN39486.1 deoxyribose-phosphate aldolase [Streptomyces hoynatensis]